MAASAVGGAVVPSAEAIFLEYAHHSREDVRGVFGRYDADGDGRLSGVEMRNLLRDVGLVSAFDTAEDVAFLKKQLVAADRDGDGAVGFDEFMVYLNTVAAPRASSTKARGKTGTKISFFAENDLFVADPIGDARSRRPIEAACASPGTPELATERGRRELSRHGTRSRIPTPPAGYSSSKAAARASPGSATKFGFANLDSPATPATPAFSGSARHPARTGLRQFASTPPTPCARFAANEKARDETPTPEAVEKNKNAPAATESPPRVRRADAQIESPSSSPPETPSPTLAFAGPSRVRDAAGDLLAFVRDLQLENERLRREAAETRNPEAAARDAANASASAAVVSETAPPVQTSGCEISESRIVANREPFDVSVAEGGTRAMEEAVKTFEAAAAASFGAREDAEETFAAETRVLKTGVPHATTKTRSNASRAFSRQTRWRPSGRAFVARAAAACLALLLLAAAARVSHEFLRGADGAADKLLETCPAPSPITAARLRSKTSGPLRVEPNVILPREAFPATGMWTF